MSWQELIKIKAEARLLAIEDAQRPLIDCPICGEVLNENSRGVVNCPMGHFRQNGRVRGRESV